MAAKWHAGFSRVNHAPRAVTSVHGCLLPSLPQFSAFRGFEDIRDAVLTGSDRLGQEHLSTLMQVGWAGLGRLPARGGATANLACVLSGPVVEGGGLGLVHTRLSPSMGVCLGHDGAMHAYIHVVPRCLSTMLCYQQQGCNCTLDARMQQCKSWRAEAQ